MKITSALSAMSVAALVALAGCSSSPDAMVQPTKTPDAMMTPSATPDSMMKPTTTPDGMMTPDAMAKHGTYVTWDAHQASPTADTTTVLFFNARWCPDCQAIHKELTADASKIPAGVTIVDVDYDKHADLRQKYGVTMQTTFVQLDKAGVKVKLWRGTSAADLTSGIAS